MGFTTRRQYLIFKAIYGSSKYQDTFHYAEIVKTKKFLLSFNLRLPDKL